MKKKIRVLLTILLAFLVALTPLFVSISCSDKKTIHIYDVHDGDTFKYGDNHKIRLFGVDTPEISQEISEDNHDYIQTEGIQYLYAVEARDFTRNLILDKDVEWEYVKKDPYDREVAKIYVDGKDLAKELISHGLARMQYISLEPGNPFYTNDYNYFDELCKIQYEAYYSHVGIWSNLEYYHDIFPK